MKREKEKILSNEKKEKTKDWLDWLKNKNLNLKALHQNCSMISPFVEDFNYSQEFGKLNLDEVKKDLEEIMRTSQKWWPADFGHYGGLFIRLAWHSAGTYRFADGRGGASRGIIKLPPVMGWPDNVNLDKAIRLLWPVKKKYGKRISWADLIILSGNVALESMGFKTLGFAGGRVDQWEPDEETFWGPEDEWMGDERHDEDGKLKYPLGASQKGLIYVNPEGPGGNPDPVEAAKEIRMVFKTMGMNDEETVALIAGGHAFGKCHGAGPTSHLGKSPLESPIESQALGWKNNFGSGKGADTITSGIELAWTKTPTKWSINFLENLFNYEWELVKGPGGAYQWVAKDAPEIIPDAYDKNKKYRPAMLTTDLALRFDPEYEKISKYFLENPDKFEQAFAHAWFKLTHRDMGPKKRYLGSDFPENDFIWQDPIPEADYKLINENDIENLKSKILSSNLSIYELVYTAWSSASTYRDSDRRGGANGARIRLEPQKYWEVNQPEQLKKVLEIYEKIKKEFDFENQENKKVSIADLIILGGCAAIEQAAKNAGFSIKVPFSPGRTDSTSEQTDTESFSVIEPFADAFRNYTKKENYAEFAEHLLIDKSQQLTLTPPEMTVLIGGLRVLGINYNKTSYGVFTDKTECLTNDFFVNLLDMNIQWKSVNKKETEFEGYSRNTGKPIFKATRVDLIFGHHPQLRAISEVYGADDAKEKFVNDFVQAWDKVMNLDRFDLFWH